jgi:XTP/dITP diphosphohydrolase
MILVLATANAGKLVELRTLLRSFAFELRDAGELGVEMPEETGATYLDNARLKAEATARATGELALGDDTGLEIAMLGGAPGLATARFAGEQGGWPRAWAELRRRTGDIDVRAGLVCALVLADCNGTIAHTQARIDGDLRWHDPPRLATMFTPDPPHALASEGVLIHRRLAFDALAPRLRAYAR